MNRANEYLREKNFVKAEAECTEALRMLERFRERAGLSFEWEYSYRHNYMAAHAYYNRGYALYYQGDLDCAAENFGSAKYFANEVSDQELSMKAMKSRDKIRDEMERTGRRGREVCPPGLYDF